MLIYLVAVVEALGYLSAVPVCVAFCLRTRGGLRFGAGVGAFDAGAAQRRARVNMARKKRKRRKARVGPGQILRLLARLKIDRLSLRGQLGLGDAAATALACGGLDALGTALRGRTDSLEIDVKPIFDCDAPRVEIRGMLRARVGQIIVAAAKSGLLQ